MADIFLSYRRSDIDRVRWMVDSLERNNLSVWYDFELNAGTHFALEIARQVETAKAMLVVWSNESVKSLWVLDEATEGKDRDILIPVSIDDVRPPFGFRQIQSTPLIGVKSEHNQDWQRVVTALKLRCKQSAKQAPQLEQAPSTKLKPDDAKDAIREMIVVYLDQKGGKQTLAAVAQAVKRAYPKHCGQNNWFGHVKFKDFVASLTIKEVTIDTMTPGYLVLNQNAPPPDPVEQSLDTADPFLARIFSDTFAPRLNPQQFGLAISAIFDALKRSDLLRPRSDLTIADWNNVVARARDLLRERTNVGIGLNRLRPILIGLRYGGLGATDAPQTPDDLRLIYAFELAKQCADAGRPLSEGEFDRVLEMVGGAAGLHPRF